MGIEPGDFDRVWRGIKLWLRKRGLTSEWLGSHVRDYDVASIKRGIEGRDVWITSDFVHDCVDALGLVPGRNRTEDGWSDGLLDEECVDLITAPLDWESH